jgi:ABC-2 type transport system ATP-binding protein
VQVDAPPAWADALPRLHVDGRDDGALLLRLDDGADEQTVLDAARAAGPVHHFSRVEPTLAELFREAVAG